MPAQQPNISLFHANAADINLALAGVRQPVFEAARRIENLTTVGEDRGFDTIEQAVEARSQ
jgi:hypothetical protein